MGFSAFLSLRMSEEKKKNTFKPSNENSKEEVTHIIRLEKDKVQKLEDEYKDAGVNEADEVKIRLVKETKKESRSIQPSVESFVELEVTELDEKLEEDWEDKAAPKKLALKWLLLIVVIVLGVMAWTAIEIVESEKRQKIVKIEIEAALDFEEQEDLEARQLIQTIKSTAENFHASKTIEEMSKYVRHVERVRPLMEDYYSRLALAPDEVTYNNTLEPLTIGSQGGFWIVESELESGKKGRLAIEVTSPFEAKVDWETFVCYQPMEWGKFVSDRPEGFTGNFRVYVKLDDFYAYEFSDSEKFQSYKLTVLTDDEPLYGYARKNSLESKKLDQLLTRSDGNAVPVILRLRIMDGAKSKRGVLIEELIAPRWLLVRSPK